MTCSKTHEMQRKELNLPVGSWLFQHCWYSPPKPPCDHPALFPTISDSSFWLAEHTCNQQELTPEQAVLYSDYHPNHRNVFIWSSWITYKIIFVVIWGSEHKKPEFLLLNFTRLPLQETAVTRITIKSDGKSSLLWLIICVGGTWFQIWSSDVLLIAVTN